MKEKDEKDFVQIIEITREIYAVFIEDDGTEYYSPIIFAALDGAGLVHLMSENPEGHFFEGEADISNFDRYHYGPKSRKKK